MSVDSNKKKKITLFSVVDQFTTLYFAEYLVYYCGILSE